jgi:hypothetical protein
MNLYRLFLPVLLAAVAVAGGASGARADGSCPAANVVFYTTDTQDLSRQLAAAQSACADYWVSISPIVSGADNGKPRGAPALTTVHQQGARFHALAELRQRPWFDFAVTQGHGWYAAGQLLHDAMIATGYEPGRDTWAVNEVGTPSGSTFSTDVFDDAPAARQGFRDFVRGLYDGATGPPMPGVVFAANPPQLAPDIWTYERGLASWYADEPFWQDMERYVRFWAQETYADVRATLVAGTTLDARAASLNDYFMHATKLRASAAAREFLSHAYTPLGNASWRQLAPIPPEGPGFGSTDVDLPTMKAFTSTQTYALRVASGSQFGYAVVPRVAGTAGAPDRLGFENYLGTAIRASESDPSDACASGACEGLVDGAAFPDTWPLFATPPVVMPHVDGATGGDGWYTSDVTVSWDVNDPQTGVDASTGCETVNVTDDTAGMTFTCSAMSSGGMTSKSVTIKRDATPPVLACTPTPSRLWPPNGKLAPVTVDVQVADAMSGQAGFSLTGAPTADAADFALGTPDVAGLLRAKRTAVDGDRIYTLTYTASDVAGNEATCDASVTVPHDQRN